MAINRIINIHTVLKSCQALLLPRDERRQSSHYLADPASWWEYKATNPGGFRRG